MPTKYISHKYIKPKTVEARLYQEKIFAKSLTGNTLAVLPTGLGKTIILALLAARRMEQHPRNFLLIMAPTKPLVEQHLQTFRDIMDILESEIVMLSGNVSPQKREEIWKQAQIIISTPQVVENDLLNKRLKLTNCSLLGVDEAHRAVGNYAYTFVAKEYMKQAKHPLIFGITASPGSDQEKIKEVCSNLSIQNLETRTDSDRDVKPYIHKRETEWLHVELPPKFKRIKKLLENSLSRKLKELKRLGWLASASINIKRRDLLKLPPQITKQFDKTDNNSELYLALGLVGSAIRLTHALELLETQGISSLLKYFKKMHKEAKSKKASKSLIRLLQEDALIVAHDIAKSIAEEDYEHPKIPELMNIVEETLELSPDSRILVFTQYRSSARLISKILNELDIVSASRFVGQASKAGDKGFTQKEQLKIMEQFREGSYNCLVATSVGEEGLDVSECDLVVFYDCVPSAVRNIQRRGRTGRKREGRVVVLIAKNTRDEGYFWASKYKERKMKKNLRELEKYGKHELDSKQKTMEDFFSAESPTSSQRTTEQQFSDKALAEIEEEVLKQEMAIPKPSSDEQKSIDSFPESAEEKKDSKIQVIIDSRESQSGIAKILHELDAEIQIKQLAISDYIVSSQVGIERKDAEDFSQSIIDGRLFPQIIALKNNYLTPLLLLEGETLYGHKALNPDAVRGAISSIILDYNVAVIWSRSTRDSARFIYSLAKREQTSSAAKPMIRTEKAPVSTNEKLEYIIAGFPNINTKLAKRILKHFGSLYNFFQAKKEELMQIKGIGEKIADEILSLIKEEYT
ncbi:MAG: DEAD/DEAH box helicase [Asgard group archaeon]|nr:DEAD/DEAH box helicase [Asgard group archaeon]